MIAGSRHRLSYDKPPVRVRDVTHRATLPVPNPATWVNDHIIIDDAQGHGDGSGTMPFTLWPAQASLIGDMGSERLLLILKARQLGISWLACAYALWLCLYHPGKVVLMFSKGQDEANELLRRVTVMYHRLPDAMRTALPPVAKSNTGELAWANGSRIKSMPATQSAGRTFTASLVVMDEAAFMIYAAALYTALKPTIDAGGQLIILSTANGKTNLFYDLVHRAMTGAGRFVFRFLGWASRPERDAAWYAATEADAVDSAHMKQEYPATPEEAFEATEEDTFLPAMALWDACRDALPPLGPHERCVLALDAAESNDTFATVIVSPHPADGARTAVRYVRPYVPVPGQPLDFDAIEADVRDLVSRYAIQEIAYDPMLLGQTVRRLTTGATPIGAPCVPFPQGAQRLEADKGLFDAITQRRIAHDGDEALRAHVSNANRKMDAEGRRLRIVKRSYPLKIDLAVALSMGQARCLALGGVVLSSNASPMEGYRG